MKAVIQLIIVLATGLYFINCNTAGSHPQTVLPNNLQYACIPCGHSCDTLEYNKPGNCTSCSMELVEKNTSRINNITPDKLCSFITDKGNQNVVLIDVRTSEEFNGTAPEKFGRLAGAINFPVQQLENNIASLLKYKNKNILVYCSHSHRSPLATYKLMQHGFTKVTNLQYGMSEWKNKVLNSKCNDSLYVP